MNEEYKFVTTNVNTDNFTYWYNFIDTQISTQNTNTLEQFTIDSVTTGIPYEYHEMIPSDGYFTTQISQGVSEERIRELAREEARKILAELLASGVVKINEQKLPEGNRKIVL